MAYADDVNLLTLRINTNMNNTQIFTGHQDEMWKGK